MSHSTEEETQATTRRIAERMGGRMFLLMNFAFFLVVLVAYLQLDYGLYRDYNQPPPFSRHEGEIPIEVPTFGDYLRRSEWIASFLTTLFSGGLVFCVTGWLMGHRAGRAICVDGKKPVWIGALTAMLPATLAAIAALVVSLSLDGRWQSLLDPSIMDRVVYPFLIIVAFACIVAIPAGMLAGYLSKVLGLRAIRLHLEGLGQGNGRGA